MRIFKKLAPLSLLIVLIYHTPITLYAQYFTGSSAGAVGDAGIAANDSGEETFLNPASLAHSPKFTGGLFYKDGYSSVDEHKTSVGINLVDNNKDVMFPGSFSYINSRKTFAGAPTAEEKYFQVSVGNFLYNQVALGFSLLYLTSQQLPGSKHEQWNGVMGLHWNPNPELGLAMVHYNLFSPEDDIPQYLQLSPKTGLGVTYIFSRYFRTRLDLLRQWKNNPDEELELAGGFETIMNDYMVLRMGGRSGGALKRDVFTTGFGFIGPRFNVNYAFRKTTKRSSGALHSVDLLVPF